MVFTTSNNSFGPTEISYLENRFCSLAKDAGRYILKNANEPTRGNITEEKEAELEEFIDYALVVIGTLGYKVFVPVSGESGPGEEKTVYYFQTKNIDARGIITSDGFAVLKGSTVSEKTAPKCPETIRKLRSKHLEKIKDGLLAEDVLFSSPSAAAGFVGGYSVNGQTAWKTAEGVSLKDMGN